MVRSEFFAEDPGVMENTPITKHSIWKKSISLKQCVYLPSCEQLQGRYLHFSVGDFSLPNSCELSPSLPFQLSESTFFFLKYEKNSVQPQFWLTNLVSQIHKYSTKRKPFLCNEAVPFISKVGFRETLVSALQILDLVVSNIDTIPGFTVLTMYQRHDKHHSNKNKM